MIDIFLDYLKKTENKSDNTIDAYKRDLEDFKAFLYKKRIDKIEDAGESHIIGYLRELKTDGRSSATITRRLSSIKSFFNFSISRGIRYDNPAATIATPKIKKKSIEYLTEDEVLRLLDMPDDSLLGRRDRAILELMYATGIRVNEILDFRFKDVNLRMGFVVCSGRYGGARIVPIGRPARLAVADYIENARDNIIKNAGIQESEADEDRILFVSFLGEKLTRQGLAKIIRNYGIRAGIEQKVTPLVIRNSFAMHMVHNGIDVKSLQELMGHESAAAAQVYFENCKVRIKDIYDRTHPRALK